MSTTADESPGLWIAGFAAVAAVAIFLVFGRALGHELVWDTIAYLEFFRARDPSVPFLIWCFTTYDVATWHPLTWLSYGLDAWLSNGFDPVGLHRTNLVLHWLTTCAIFALVLTVDRTFAPAGDRTGLQRRGFLLLAALGALAWAVHPLRVESVAWVAGRKDVLCALFLALAAIAYLEAQARDSRRVYFMSVLAYALAVLCKPIAVVLPPVLVLIELLMLRRGVAIDGAWLSRITRRTAPFWLLALLLATLTLAANVPVLAASAEVSVEQRLTNAFIQITGYLHKALLPLTLSPYYLLEASSVLNVRFLVAFGGVLAMTGLVVYLAQRRRTAGPLLAWLAFLVCLLPVLGFVKFGLDSGADRFTYIPQIPIFILAIYAGDWVLRRRKPGALILVLGLGAVIGYGALARAYVPVWQDATTLWAHASLMAPERGFPLRNLAGAYYERGQFEPAARAFAEAHRLEPLMESRLLLPWAYAHMYVREHDEAIGILAAADRQGILVACTRYNIAWNLAGLDRGEEALAWLDDIEGRDGMAQLRVVADQLREVLEGEDGPETATAVPFCELLVGFGVE